MASWLLLAAAFLIAPRQADSQERDAELRQYLERAQIHLDKENYNAAIEALHGALVINELIPGANYQLGLAHFRLGQSGEAEAAFLKELKFEPPDPYSLYYLGRIQLNQGETAEAIDYFERVLAVGTLLDVRSRLAGAYLRSGEISKAVDLLEEAIRMQPEQGEVHYLLGRAYQRQGRAEDARRAFDLAARWKSKAQGEIRQLLELRALLKAGNTAAAATKARDLSESTDPDVTLAAGIALGEGGRNSESEALLRRTIELQPQYAEAHYNLALTYVAAGRPAEALPVLARAIDLRPELYEARLLMGHLLVEEGERHEAIEHLRAAAAIRPDNSKLWAFLGLQYLEGRYFGEAIEAFRRGIELGEDDSGLRFLLIQALHGNHDFEEALAEAQQAATLFPNLPQSHFHLALELDNIGRFAEARTRLEHALEVDQEFSEARILLGQVMMKLGDTEGGAAQFRRVISQDPGAGRAYAGLGRALVQLKQYEEVVRLMTKAISIDRESASLHLYLAQAYRGLGRMAEAKRESDIFSQLNRERAEQRDAAVERTYKP